MNLTLNKQKELPVFGDMIADLFIDDFFKPVQKIRKQNVYPPVNIQELESYYLIDIAAPGFEKQDFSIALNKNILSVSSKTKEAVEKDVEQKPKLNFRLKEFSVASFNRDFTLPENVAIENIKATYNAGILSIEIPKAVKEVEKPKLITIL
ncbi:Hsp20/alpha crystallin family protein [Crocinitomix catalasitica]|uniref:Hsp20/alpha crystallin family protein n=1 Tax=Crocinitomix catalasitica TaxID=184607 RepID=UPI000688FB3C|nr:Hsp20/alpha crystallin family protein [Crocinitomix catalasitica]